MRIRIYKKMSRNEKCPCGSGLKVKFCSCDGTVAKDDYLELSSLEVIRENAIIGTYKAKGEVEE